MIMLYFMHKKMRVGINMVDSNSQETLILEESLKQTFIDRSILKSYRQGEILFAQGDDSDCVYLVKKGRVKACHLAKDGTSITLLIHEKGEIVGVGGVIDQKPRAVFAFVDSKECQLWRMDAEDFIEMMKTNALLSYHVAIALARRQKSLDTQILRQISIRANDRISVVLFDLAMKSPYDSGDLIKIKITQQEIADMIGTCRQTATTMIGNLKDDGIIETHKGYIIIRDIEKLKLKALQVSN